MSHIHPTSTSSNFQLVLDNALKAYKKRTKKDLLKHPLADRLRGCDSASNILTLLQEQVQELNESQRSNTKWLDPTVNVIYAFSETLGEGVGSAFSPAKVIFTGFAVLISTAKAVRADQDALFEMFEHIEAFFRRLDIYTEVAPNQGMLDTITAIMVEVLNFVGIVTKEIKQGKTKKYMKKVIGRNDMKDALRRLDGLTQEARMAAAQLLEVTGTIDHDNRVEDIDEEVNAVVSGVQYIFNQSSKIVQLWQLLTHLDGIGRAIMIRPVDNVDVVKRNHLRQDFRRWLSPPDPSTNHNIACKSHHRKTTNWFFQGSIYNEWKTTGSELLWIHGKPGSGKSILCSVIIQDIKAMCDEGHALMAYFYFDFRDIDKQHLRDLLASLLTQLPTRSNHLWDILSQLYSDHDSGAKQPNDDTLIQCLKEMLKVPDQRPTYLIMDALDECSDVSGIPTPRRRVLRLLKELVDLQIPNLHICITSRPEVDIQDVLEALTSRRVSLHDQSGQKKDIEDYVRSFVYSKSEPIMRRWRTEDKELVIETLCERADGMFRWIFYQLEVLRDCLPSSVRRTLNEFPESLDETYERILKEIKKANRALARRVFQCLLVAIRPLRVAELAEILAVDFDDVEGIPRLKPDWRWEDQERALLSACSSLIKIVEAGDSRVVQFSHFSVKEFLTSSRLATSIGDISNYYVDFEPAHTILAKACLGVLLQIQNGVEGHTPEPVEHPLARYAAEFWTTHAQVGEVSARLPKGMKHLFDPEKPTLFHDTDAAPNERATFYWFAPYDNLKSPTTPLYDAALCGFHELVEHLITEHPQDVNADGGYYLRPLVAALAGEHFQTADLLRRNGATLHDVRGVFENTPLHAAAFSGNLEVVRRLIEYNPADIHALDESGSTPLLWASRSRYFKDGSVLRLLLEHGADINQHNQIGLAPLHWASFNGTLENVRLLLEHGADVEAEHKDGKTALQYAAEEGHDEVVELLREYGAK